MTDWVMANRRALRMELIVACRGRCYQCGKLAGRHLEMHEIITRNMTLKNDAAREASFARELVSMLCHDCHERANTPNMRTVLLALNIKRFGYEQVDRAFVRLLSLMRTRPPVHLPLAEEVDAILAGGGHA